jgi:Uma2 family endonuclease
MKREIAVTTVAKRLITAEEFARMPGSKHMELIRGEVRVTMPPGKEHGAVALAIGTLLHLWVKQGAGGEAGVEAGFILAHDPDVIRGPDVYYVSAGRIPSDDKSSAFWTIAPDLAVEVISPSETADDIREKIRDFLSAGTQLVWVVFPRTQEVVVHTPDGFARTYGADDVIEYPDLLPGFSCKVAELFS